MMAFDIGANVGKLTAELLRDFDKVICVEANSGLINKLRRRFEWADVTVVHAAAAEKEGGHIPFYVSNEHTLSTASVEWITKSRFAASSRWDRPVEVPTTSLNYLMRIFGVPDFIKVDVEGFELTVFKGLSKPVPKLCFEWAEELFSSTVKCVKRLQEIGYTQFGLTHGEYQRDQLNSVEYARWERLIFDTSLRKRYGMIWAKV